MYVKICIWLFNYSYFKQNI